ncbi:GNAT family N-acetyltransferase [Streptomyces gobiensis]|uniref:GNAT family N-acetyltransferase n=1 Tax=Streptomyces gobiensis TaxID=2875706 RepID=UPI001E45A947|nr:GNAT family N-acetyltransferase [Streptomyces gobiensis]UGY91215.1 N-acetyltransferase [Streptomyces gobiensis]
MDVTIEDNAPAARFEAYEGDDLVGFATYTRKAGVVVYQHTEVEPEYRRQGIGGALVRAALDDARQRGLRVRALCPFVSSWMDRHPEYRDLGAQEE